MSTIYDIAEKTGYSASTVSKALNNYDNISQKAKDKIMKVAKELNYIPNASARGLMTRKSYVIGLLVYEEDKEAIIHSHLSGIIASFKNYVESKGYDVLFVNTSKNSDLTYYERCRYRSLDGLLLAMGDFEKTSEEKKKEILKHNLPSLPKEQIDEIINSDLPVVSVETIYENTNTVLCDNYKGATEALEYLYFLGHRKIAYIDAESTGDGSNERRRAYENFLRNKETDFLNEEIYISKGFKRRHGLEVAKQIVMNGFSNLPSAIFCVCDEVAIGVIEQFKTQGIKVPEDISIIGFDDIKVAEYVGLTTVRQNRKLIGDIAGQRLVAEIEGDTTREVIRTEPELVIRNTCKSVK